MRTDSIAGTSATLTVTSLTQEKFVKGGDTRVWTVALAAMATRFRWLALACSCKQPVVRQLRLQQGREYVSDLAPLISSPVPYPLASPAFPSNASLGTAAGLSPHPVGTDIALNRPVHGRDRSMASGGVVQEQGRTMMSEHRP